MRRLTKNICYLKIILTMVLCLQLGLYLLVHFSPKRFASPTLRLSSSNNELRNKLNLESAKTQTKARAAAVTTTAKEATTATTTTVRPSTTLKTEQRNNSNDTETLWRPLKYKNTLITNRTCSQQYSLLILVSSAPANVERRNYIRKTWAFDNKALKPRWTTVFLVAQSRSQDESNSLLKEDELYGDLVRADYYDHYWNQTLKIQMGFEWATRYCKFSFLLKVDDDVFVNSAKFLSFLRKPTTPREQLYMGVLRKGRHPRRKGKWKITVEEYSAKYYPDYCPGFAILFSQDTVVSLVKTFPILPYYRLDDVYVGLLADRNGIKLRHNDGFEVFPSRKHQCIPNQGTLVRHGYFGKDGRTHGDCYMRMFNQATAQK